jgi:hypothetical protein
VYIIMFIFFIENIQCFVKKLMPYVYVLLFISSLQKQVWNFFIIWWCSNILIIYRIYVKLWMHCNSKVIQYDIELFIILIPHMVDISNYRMQIHEWIVVSSMSNATFLAFVKRIFCFLKDMIVNVCYKNMLRRKLARLKSKFYMH